MDPCLDRYISYEYLVSPCPEGSRTAADTDRPIVHEVKRALEAARDRLQAVKMQAADEATATALYAAEAEVTRALALLDSLGGGWAA
jgi:hypothetical protein